MTAPATPAAVPVARKPFLIGGAATALLIAVLALPERQDAAGSVTGDPAGEAQEIYQAFVEKVTQSSRLPEATSRTRPELPPLTRDIFSSVAPPPPAAAAAEPSVAGDAPDAETEPEPRYQGTYREAGRRFVFLDGLRIAVGDSVGTRWVVDADATHVTLWSEAEGYTRIERSPGR